MNNHIKRILVGLAASVAASTAVLAADIAPVLPAPAPVVVVPAAAPVFDWAGTYVGTRGEVLICEGLCWINLDGHAGYNFVAGRFLAGVELGAGMWFEGGDRGWEANFMARTGIVLGRLLAYGKVGFTVYGPAPVDDYLLAGGGVEMGIGRSVSVFAGFVAEREIGGGPFYPGVEAGVNFHLGN